MLVLNQGTKMVKIQEGQRPILGMMSFRVFLVVFFFFFSFFWVFCNVSFVFFLMSPLWFLVMDLVCIY